MTVPDADEVDSLRARLTELEAERSTLIERLERLRGRQLPAAGVAITVESSAAEKIALFRGLFSGRTDVFPIRWEKRNTGKSGYAPACSNEWLRGVCGKPQVRCGECPNQAFLGVSDQTIANHLRGLNKDGSSGADFVAGVYPVLADGFCHFLAADFDGEHWAADALAFCETCRLRGVPAVPLQRRARDYGNSVFVDRHLHAYRDQWAFLADLRRLTPEEAYSIVGAAAASDRVLAVRMPIADESGDEPWNQSAPRRQSQR